MALQWPSGHPWSACSLLTPMTLFLPQLESPDPMFRQETRRGEPSGALEEQLQAQTLDMQPFNSGRHLFQVILESKTTDLILESTSLQSRCQRMQLTVWSVGAHPALGKWKFL